MDGQRRVLELEQRSGTSAAHGGMKKTLELLQMKIYPNPHNPEGSYSAEDIRRGFHWVNTDVTCTVCGKVQPLAVAGSTDNGKCIKCGGRTS
jgi:hypothetical protein